MCTVLPRGKKVHLWQISFWSFNFLILENLIVNVYFVFVWVLLIKNCYLSRNSLHRKNQCKYSLSVIVGFTFFFLIYLFIDWLIDWLIGLCWVFVSVRGLSPVAASGGHSSSRCAGLSLSWPLLSRSTGSRRAGSAVVAHGPSSSAACGIFPDQGSNPCSLHWQADSQPLRHQGSPGFTFDVSF